MSRIFKQLGQGYSASPVTVNVLIDGNTVFSGTIPTVDAPVPGYEPDVNLGADCFSWTEADANFTGSRALSIAVSGGYFQTGVTLAQSSTGNSMIYGQFNEQDPLSDVQIDGVPYVRDAEPPGQWGWTIQNGQTLTATLTVTEVPDLPPEDIPE
jgi:hypothetical protein